MSLLATLALSTPALAVDAPVERHALLVGANDGGRGRVVLQYAHDDARAMATILTELGGVPPDRRTLLLDPDADSLDNALGQLASELRESGGRAEVIFYYSGHSDETGLLLGEDHLSYRDLRGNLEGLPADVRIAILDSCASGAMVRAKGGLRVAPFMVDESNQLDGFAIITSSAADEVAQEADSVGGSYFTHFLATGLRGAADLSQDGRVTLDEAYAFAHAETLARTERSQHGPQHANRGGGLDGQGHLVLTDLQLTTASLVLDELLTGRALIRDNDGDLVAELLKPGGRAIELGLGAGDYDILLTVDDSDRYATASVTLVSGSSTLLEASDLTWFDAESAVARGGDAPLAVLMPNDRRRRSAFRIQLLPGVPPAPDVIDSALVGIAAARSRQLDGVAVAMGGLFVDREARGMMAAMGVISSGELRGSQLSLGANIVGGQTRGIQGTLGANIAGGHVAGLQGSLGGNIAGRGLRGVQGTLGINVATGDLQGIQASLGANLAGDTRGIQATMGANVARDLVGLQTSVGANVARAVDGLQAGSVNIAKKVDGAQIGIVNIGGDVRGAQIGLVNVANDVKGLNLGLLTFERQGRHDLLIYASETDIANLEFKLGGKALHTVFGAGVSPGEHGWVGLGWGAHVRAGDTWWLDIDAIAQTYTPLVRLSQPVDGVTTEFRPLDSSTQVGRLRLTLGAQLKKNLAVFGGVHAAIRFSSFYQSKNLDVVPGVLASADDEILIWPGAFAGVQF